MGDEVQAIKAGLLEVADLVVVTKGDRPGADRAAAQLRAMVTVGAQHDRAMGDRPRPKRPEVLVVSSLTGAGLSELLAAIDRRAPDPASAASARLARARTQVLGILGERLRERLLDGTSAGAMEAVVADVAAHRLDPYAAADRLLSVIVTREDHPPSTPDGGWR
jgi:LAO/AO transport system kinase